MPQNQHRPLEGRVAWVTGGASGIGRATAERLRAMGAAVAVLDLQPSDSSGGPMQVCDISSRESVEQAARTLEAELGPAHILVNCAGIAAGAQIAGHDPGLWDRMVGVNLTGPFNLLRRIVPSMTTLGWGRIVLIGSDGAFLPSPGLAAYTSTKAAIPALARSVACEVGAFGITCNVISPGTVDTPMTRSHFGSRQALEEAVSKPGIGNAMGVVLTPEDVAFAIGFLCQPEAQHITGQTISVNAGGLMR